ncbi:tol-pal system protein YbgF [Kistimonas scapharcae]|uniref:Cell division coordinator CpoB n=1 Tax=Kistimonas scapharcae TaxID=1036133 RepID=A0ABP8V1D6_9GAMM
MSLVKLRRAVIMTGLCSLPVLAAPVPVVDSNPSSLALPAANAQSNVLGVSAPVGQAGALLEQISSLQQEVLQLRGLVEEQANALQRLSQENRDRYLDLDRRIGMLSKSGSAPETPVASRPRDTGSASGAVSAGGGVTDSVSEQAVYQDAFQLIRTRKFDEAIVALNDYIRRFPAGTYADNAQYWLGEVYLAQGKLEQSKGAFETVLKDYPKSGKSPDAMYKLGRVFDQLGDKAQSEKYLKSVISQYSQSSAAKLADVYLRSLQSKPM